MTKKIIAVCGIAMATYQAAFAQGITFSGALTEFNSTLESGASSLFNLLSIVMGIIAAVFAVLNLVKYLRGGGQDSDNSLLKVAGGILIVALLLQVIKVLTL